MECNEVRFVVLRLGCSMMLPGENVGGVFKCRFAKLERQS